MATQDDSGGSGPFQGFGTLRRSLRQINPFKSRIFRLPATPRLSRKGKVIGKGEELTGWNFERPQQPLNSNRATPVVDIFHASTPSSSITPDISQHLDGIADDVSSVHFRFTHDSISQGGGSCRTNGRHSRPPLPSYNPPDANEAENLIQEHMKNLLSSPAMNRRYLFLPNTSYDKQGEVSDACWQA
uniref:Uncharacterized protein n=1 Tax=Acrobeloides nanus TaxID=290746 RepID=A0A914CQ04_9BILA